MTRHELEILMSETACGGHKIDYKRKDAHVMLQVVLDNINHIVETYEIDQVGSFITLTDEFKKG